jgi:thiol-disulfide isomerase/thioredoxin
MRRALCALSLSLFAAVLPGCRKAEPRGGEAEPSQAASSRSAPGSPEAAHRPGAPWFQGSPEQAFAAARSEKKLLFLAWSAVWCPPCNELKADVFTKPRFAELMRDFIPVYLDGDTEEAQAWGDKLNATSYPTVLVLTPEADELIRFSGGFGIGELERAIEAVKGPGRSFRKAIERLEAGAPAAEDIRILAQSDWDDLPEADWPPLRRFSTIQNALERCPAELRPERAMLASHLLTFAVTGQGNEALARPLADLAEKAGGHLDAIFEGPDTAWAARAFVHFRAGNMAEFLFQGRPEDPKYKTLKKRWLDAAAAIRGHRDASVGVRLWSMIPMLDFFRFEDPSGPIPDAMKAEIEAAAVLADRDAKNPFERHAVISGAVYLLRRVSAHEKARAMLLAEAARSDTPYYYYSGLSALEQELGRTAEARSWSEKARKNATGRATRMQWIANDILLNAKLEGPEQKGYLKAAAEEFYELATAHGDGFMGRNRLRAEQIRGALAPLRDDPAMKELFARYRARCSSLAADGQKACLAHFDGLR